MNGARPRLLAIYTAPTLKPVAFCGFFRRTSFNPCHLECPPGGVFKLAARLFQGPLQHALLVFLLPLLRFLRLRLRAEQVLNRRPPAGLHLPALVLEKFILLRVTVNSQSRNCPRFGSYSNRPIACAIARIASCATSVASASWNPRLTQYR